MPRIPPALLESIKRDVSCVAVLEARGSVFAPHGADVVTACPFHDDRTPSLIVSTRKNLWRCHGACGVGGDVIALEQKLRGVSFRHAVELLANGLPGGAAAKEAASTFAAGSIPQSRRARMLPCPLEVDADDARLFQQVVDYYAQRLHESGNAGRAYLASRGLDDTELLRRFAFGYADRTLGLRLPAKGWKAGAALRGTLETLGLFRASGHEHFSGSVVVPIHGDDGAVVGMYGRKVRDDLRAGTPSHTYLPGKHRGIWNSGPGLIDGNGAVVVCEALFDAASYWVSGVRNVTAAYGVNGWTDDHWKALSDGKARDVFVAFDADAAGDAAGATLADLLIGRGYTVYRVAFPSGMDANECMTTPDGGRDALRATLATARWLGGTPRVPVPTMPVLPVITASAANTNVPAAAMAAAASFAAAAPSLPPGVTVTTEADELAVLIGTRRYRVRGLDRNRSADVLKVNLRLGVDTAHGERFHVDTLDLYQTRLRQAFTAAAGAETGLEHDLLKADLGKLMLTLECQQMDRRRREATAASATEAAPTAEMPADQRAAALALLCAPDLVARIGADLTRCGLVGETINKLVAYIATTSRRLDNPLAIVVQSSSAAGKSTLMDKVLSLMPPEDVRQYSAISGKSPFYLGTANLKHRILAVAEEEGARRASYALKLLQSDGFLSMAATGKDPQSGKLVTHDYRVEGPVMLMLTTTAIDVDPELLNRCLVLTVDEETAQTAAIQASQREARTLAGLAAKRERAAIETLHRNAQRLLRSLCVVNPHAPALSFAAGQTRLRRDHAKYLALIDAVAFLHQHQREVKRHAFADGSTLEYIEVSPADIALADELARAVLGRSLDDLPPQTRRLWEALRAFVAAEAERQGLTVDRVRFTRREAQAALGWSYQQARIHLDRLADQEFIVMAGGGHGQVVRYRLVDEGAAAAGPLPPSSAPACTPVPTSVGMTKSLFGFTEVCPPIVGLGGTNENDGKNQSFIPNKASLFASRVHDGGGLQLPHIIVIGTDATASPLPAQAG